MHDRTPAQGSAPIRGPAHRPVRTSGGTARPNAGAAGLLALQRSAGNHATATALQRSLTGDVLDRGVFDGAMLAQADRGLPRSLITHYMEGTGEPYELTVAEMLEVNAVTRVFDWFPEVATAAYRLSAMAAQAHQRMAEEQARPRPRMSNPPIQDGPTSRAFTIPITNLRGRAVALKNQTLGNFTITMNGALTRGFDESTLRFDGTATYYDYWDFDPKLWDTFVTGTSGRSTAGEVKTVVGALMEGAPFAVESGGEVHVSQLWDEPVASITANATAGPPQPGADFWPVAADISDSVDFAGEAVGPGREVDDAESD